MQVTIKLSFILLFALLFQNCISEREENKIDQSLSLVKTDSVVLQQGEVLFGKFQEQMKITSDGRYWIFADRIRQQVFVFNQDGSFHSVIGERGRGPQGILRITGYDVNDDHEVFIFDASQRMLKIFTVDDSLIYSTKFFEDASFSPTAFNLLWYEDKILMSVVEDQFLFEPHKSRLLAEMALDDVTDTLYGLHDPFTEEDNQFSIFSEITLDKENQFVYTNLESSPYFQVYDLHNKQRIAYGGIQTEHFKIPSQEVSVYSPIPEKERKMTGTSGIQHIFLTDDFFVQHMQVMTKEWFETGDYTTKNDFFIVYDRKTNEFIEEIPVRGVPAAAFNNKLYAFDNLNPDKYTIGIYELRYES